MRFKHIAILVHTMLFLSTMAFAESDTGKVIEIYAHPDGQMALKLNNGLPNSNRVNSCGYTGEIREQFAGVESTDDNSIKSTMLAAKATGSEVIVVTFGKCLPGGWIKIEAIHMK